QLPIFLGVYQAVQRIAADPNSVLAAQPFLWLPRLDVRDPSYVLPLLSIALQMLTSLMAMPKIQDAQQKVMSQTMLLLPIVFGYVAFTFNSGAVLYWVISSILAVVQQYFVTGWGSLSNYLTFLPERQGYLTPVMPSFSLSTDAAPAPESTEPARNFWEPLAKLQASPALQSGETATEAVIADAKRQAGGGKKRR
ncbi:MAG TPA: YidC/Oxa1 family membrane protein insertase, partial [Herpetosiphonaceae bacterium]|nr:YidC/Oxa1 family membrane protein insertase [Herpetosiphonaceae bacterium]